MKKKIITIASIGIITLSTLLIPFQASAYSYTNYASYNNNQSITNSIGYWTYEYINGKLTRKFVYTKEDLTKKNTNLVKTTTNKTSKDTYKIPTGYWTYEYINGKLTRKFVYSNETQNTQQKDNLASPNQNPTTNISQDTQNHTALTSDEKNLYDLINQERKMAGLQPVQIDMEVVKAARLKSEDMVKNNYFAHQSPTYGDARQMLRNMHIDFLAAAENIAINGSVSRVHSSFMTSSVHKSNILGSGWTHVGIGVSKRTNGTGIIVTEIFLKK